MIRAALALVAILISAPLAAQGVNNPPMAGAAVDQAARDAATAAQAKADAAATPASVSSAITAASVFVGSFTRTTAPACNSSTLGKYAFITDLAGGADTVICRTAGPWARIRIGAPEAITATSGTVTVSGLANSNFLSVTGAVPALTTLTLNIDVSTMAPNSIIYVKRPGVLSGVINVQLSSGGGALSLLGNSTATYFFDGSTLSQLQ